jgi:hypothetical protein
VHHFAYCCKTGKLEIIETKRFGLKPLNNKFLNQFGETKNKRSEKLR